MIVQNIFHIYFLREKKQYRGTINDNELLGFSQMKPESTEYMF